MINNTALKLFEKARRDMAFCERVFGKTVSEKLAEFRDHKEGIDRLKEFAGLSDKPKMPRLFYGLKR